MVGRLEWSVDEPVWETPDGSRPGHSLSTDGVCYRLRQNLGSARDFDQPGSKGREGGSREAVGTTCTQVSTSKRRLGGDPLHLFFKIGFLIELQK